MRQGLLVATLILLSSIGQGAWAEGPAVQVYKSPTCGCCNKWIEHLRANGFSVDATNVRDVHPLKAEKGIPANLSACHTAVVGGYVVEGHVPAADIRRLLQERPRITGIAVPNMPEGSPGMEGPNPKSYDVLAFGTDGVRVFSHHDPSR